MNNDGEGDPKYFLWEMNLTGFSIPSSGGRWALNPALGSLEDSDYDIDNDTLLNDLEGPDRCNTNPVNNDTDGDRLPDGWEVKYGLNPLDSEDALLDLDGDSFDADWNDNITELEIYSNLYEYRNGTDPTNVLPK